ncbi:Peroxisome chaperone and import receptor [Paramarasmius palmivorus]|uniref:Peroxisome chaperone and import receptor n=1 Tax=Paramarasmius palmivorus TaxID=297713 RepID=A0AAW0EF48_9AGAR
MSEPLEKVKPTAQHLVDEDDDLDELDASPVMLIRCLIGIQSTHQVVGASSKRELRKVRFWSEEDNTRIRQTKLDEAALSDEFARELAKNMEELMKELVTEGESSTKSGGPETEEDKEKEAQRIMKAAWEAMLVEGMNGMTGEDVSEDNTASRSEGPNNSGDFQSKIKQTMDKLKESESNLKAGSSAGAPDTLEGLLESLQDLGLDNEDDPEFNGFLENVMGHLMSKDILYPPLKELSDNYPPYLANPPKPLSATEKEQYEAQLVAVRKIIAIYEKPDYDDKNTETSKEIVDLMGEVVFQTLFSFTPANG